MLIDDFLPAYEFSERHRTLVRASPETVRRAVDDWCPGDSKLWRLLPWLRGLGRPSGSLREWAENNRFLCLADTPEELVFGIAGRFWAIKERSAVKTPGTVEGFMAFDDPRSAVAVMNITLRRTRSGATRLSTETRIHTPSGGTRRRFRLYWLAIRPFSGLLRRSMLNGMASLATKRAGASRLVEGS